MSHIDYLPTLETKDEKMYQPNAKKLTCNKDNAFELRLLFLSLRHKKLSRFLEVVLVILNILGCVYCVTGKSLLYNQSDHFKSIVVLSINCLSDILLVAVNIFGIVGFVASDFIVELFTFISIDDVIAIKKKRNMFVRFVHMLRVSPVLPICLEIYFFGFRIGWSMFQYFLPREIWYYGLNWMVCSLVSLVDKIRWSFAAINDHLEELCQNTELSSNQHHTNKASINIVKLTQLGSRFNHLCNLLDRFNHIIKAFLVMLVMSITINILYNCTVLIEFGAKPKVINGVDTKIFVCIVQILLALTTVGQAAVAGLVGECLQEEGERTSSICYSALTKINKDVNNENQNAAAEKELNFILDQSKTRRICLHAGGFFDVNWGIIGSITSTVATYSIVILQFLLK